MAIRDYTVGALQAADSDCYNEMKCYYVLLTTVLFCQVLDNEVLVNITNNWTELQKLRVLKMLWILTWSSIFSCWPNPTCRRNLNHYLTRWKWCKVIFYLFLFIKASQHKCWRSVGHQVLQPAKDVEFRRVCLKSCRQEKKSMMHQDSLEPAAIRFTWCFVSCWTWFILLMRI